MIDDQTVDVVNFKKLLSHLKYTEAWIWVAANEYDRLFQEYGRNEDGSQHIQRTNVCHKIKKCQVPKGKTATYNRLVTDIQPEIAEPNWVRFTAGGNIVQYTGETLTEVAPIETAKLLITIKLSTMGEKYMAMNMLNFYTHNDLKDYQYM